MRTEFEILDICQDSVFKAVFTKDTPQSRRALSDLVSTLIRRDVEVLSITSNEPPVDGISDRQIRFDIACKFETGELANVEMTIYPGKSEMLRCEYHAARLQSSADIQGKDKSYRDLQYTYQISFLGTHLFFDDDAVTHTFEYYDKEHSVSLGGRSRIITVELSKLGKVLDKDVSQMTGEECWAVYLRYSKDKAQQNKISEIIKQKEGIAMANEVLMTISQDEREWAYQTSRYKYIVDTQSQMVDAKREGRAEGLAEGLARGEARGEARGKKKGRAEQAREIARNLKKINLSAAHIAQVTGLTLSEIEEL